MAIGQAALFSALKAAGPTRTDALRRMDAVAHLLDTAFLIPGTRQRVGIDAFIGLVPGIGDLVTTVLSSYIIWEARQLGAPKRVIARMLVNLGLHASIGTLPLVGDAFDAFFRVNRRNMRILRQYLAEEARGEVIEAEYRAVPRAGSAGGGVRR